MKGICITDVHLQNSRPLSRLDSDYLMYQLTELKYIFSLANDIGIKHILCAGDLGHSYSWEPRTMNLFHSLCMDHNITVVTTLGQHDVFKQNIVGYKEQSSLNVLEKTGVVRVLHGGQKLELDDQIIYGFGFNEPETISLLNGTFAPKRIEGDKMHIALIHASVGEAGTTGIKDIINNQRVSGFEFAFFGDIHQGFKPCKLSSGTIAASSGSLGRHSITDAYRTPMYIEYDTENPNGLVFQPIPHPAPEILFDLDTKKYQKAVAETWKEYAVTASKITIKKPDELVREVVSANNIDDRVVGIIIENMGDS